MDVQSRQRAAEITSSTRLTVWISILVVRLFSRVAYHTPVRIGYTLCDWVGYLLYWRSLRYRRAVADNLRHAHYGRIDETRLRRQTITVFRMSARNFWDLLCLPRMTREELRATLRMQPSDWERIEQLADQEHGTIIISAHLGAFDFVGQYVVASKFKPLVLTTPTVSPFLFAGVTYLRTSMGARIEIANTHSLRALVNELRAGGMIGLVADRDFGETGRPVTLFDAETTLPSGPIKLARQTGAPLVPWLGFREHTYQRRRGFVVMSEPPIYVARTANRDADIACGLQQLAELYERAISQAPDQWVMFQPVWPEAKARHGWRAFAARQAAQLGLDGSSDFGVPAEPLAVPPDDVDAPTPLRPAG